MNKHRRLTALAAGVALAALPLAACGNNATEDGEAMTATRTVTDYSGAAIEVPADPQAVIGMDISDTAALVALGITPVAANDRIAGQFVGTEDFLPDGFDPATLPTFGLAYEPNFENIASLEPDLIIGNEFMNEMSQQMSQVAPTVLVSWPDNGSWQQRFQDVADAVGRGSEAAEVEADFQDFIDSLPEGLDGTTVAFVRPTPDGGLRIDSLPTAFPGSVADQAGIDMLIPDGVGELDEGSGFIELSGEFLDVLRGADLIVVPDYTVTGAAEEDAVTQFASNPLWEELPAVRNGRVAQVPGLVYNGGNYYAAKALLAALVEQLS
ncbi:iron-siderophore ABC transporter substrate-binding protein [Hoyosella sp. G463]|uniref:Iron-siderophore ABC transporter substrate-binding protein n=1 Tax=Lolliginicoccus lacisalsi TaxID=2742202 RepID=A0A927J9J0_9ACTN|nr:iron-siderophore ABC transporter substrate-binding protein [Lolliginicoccus lacisalsi]MBD8505089.1 iron-siderophore ABC transporter substrate-binding protein [Lolliginicoccus lacisalsi]